MKKNIFKLGYLAVILGVIVLSIRSVYAQVPKNYTSASYILSDPIFGESGPYSQSTNFKEKDSLGQLVTGVSQSTNFIIKSGFEYYSGQSVPSITMTINSNIINFNNILPGIVYKSPTNTIITISSNSENGYNLYANQNRNLTNFSGDQIPPVTNGATTTIAEPYISSSNNNYQTNISSTAYTQAILSYSPVAFLPLSETSGTSANDLSGNSNNGTYTGGYTLGQPGPVSGVNLNYAVSLNGSSGYVNLPLNILNNSTFPNETFSLWFKTTNNGGLLGNQSGPLGGALYNNILYVGADGTLCGGISPANGNSTTGICSSNTVNNGSWNNAVLAVNSTEISLYLNGQLVQQTPALSGTQNLAYNQIGWSNGGWTNSGAQYFSGDIADVAIYHSSLTSSQIQKLYQYATRTNTIQPNTGLGYSCSTSNSFYQSVLADSPIMFLSLSETSGTIANDLSGNSNNGTYIGGYAQGKKGPISNQNLGYSTYFNGNSYVNLPVNTVNNTNESAKTYSLWFKTTSNGGLLANQNVSAGYSAAGWNNTLYIGSNGELCGGMYPPNSGICSSSSVNNGEWNNAVLAISSTAQYLYLNGQLVQQTSGSSSSQNLAYNQIGWSNSRWNNSGAQYFNGDIADVAIYNSTLTQSQIQTIFNAGINNSSPFCNSDFVNSTYYRQFSNIPTEFASYSSIANNQAITINYAVSIGSSQAAGNYTNTITYTVSGDY